jgi:STE24 endopeptidase
MPLFSWIFLAAMLATLGIKLWLARRQRASVAANRAHVPAEFAEKVTLAAHQKAADYTVAKTRLGNLELLIDALFVLLMTLGGGLDFIDRAIQAYSPPGLVHDLLLIGAVTVLSGIVSLPFSIYRTFAVEARFGFNRVTVGLFIADLLKQLLLGAAIGIPLISAVLWMMAVLGDWWWIYAWVFWMLVNVLMITIFPTWIAPLFNKFSPLANEELKTRIENLLTRCGFKSQGLFVMDGSKRSSHGNAYFTGFGKSKRIVFFDTLIERLQPTEIEAVLAHELGHFKRRHITKRIVLSFVISFVLLALLGWLIGQPWFYTGLGVSSRGNAMALILFFAALPAFTFALQPLSSMLSRKHEFEADEYAAQQTHSGDLVTALVKLYQDNASTLTPDPLYSAIYDSHPPAAIRIAHLKSI